MFNATLVLAAFLATTSAAKKTPLEKEITRAEYIISGEIIEVKPVTGLQEVASEKNPNWHWAIIRVDSPLKVPRKFKSMRFPEIRFVFANSTDPAWEGSPRPSVGDRGIWILRWRKLRTTNGVQIKVLSALKPLNYQSLDQLEKIQKIIETQKEERRRKRRRR